MRQYAGFGTPHETNERFKFLISQGQNALNVAFDLPSQMGLDSDDRRAEGEVGRVGMAIDTLKDMEVAFDGIPIDKISVSLTVNAVTPMMLAMFLNTAIDQQVDRFTSEQGREPSEEEFRQIRGRVLENVRGTVQADILKEDQGQNTCIFSIDFALKMMGDIQQYFIDNNVRNFYSVSISGYHIREAGSTAIAFSRSNIALSRLPLFFSSWASMK